MKVLPTSIAEVILLEPAVFGDARGRFLETFRRDRYRDLGVGSDLEFVQDNFSSSTHGILRGLHYQLVHPQGKLVWVTRGEVFDVAVDIRRGSPTFRRWVGATLSADNHRQLWIPPGFAHGFVVTSDVADFAYKCTAYYDAADEHSIRWDDPDVGIAWPLTSPPTLSKRDQEANSLRLAPLPTYAA